MGDKWVEVVLIYIKLFFPYVCQQRSNPYGCSNILRIFLCANGGHGVYCPNSEDMGIIVGWFKG